MPDISCLLCDSQDHSVLKKQSKYTFLRCRNCGLSFLYPQPRTEDLYTEKYYASWGLDVSRETPASLRFMKMNTFNMRLDEIEKFVRPGRILDVGCATGFAMEVAKERGWEPYGVELSEYSSSIARKKFGSAVVTGDLFDAGYEDNYFDAVLLSDLLEHVQNPIDTLIEVRRTLSAGGIVSIITPNIDSFSSKIMGRSWMHFKLEHLYYFSPTTIAHIIKKADLKLAMTKPAKKAINLSYFLTQVAAYGNPSLSKALTLFSKIIPHVLREKVLRFEMGEMEVMAIKETGA